MERDRASSRVIRVASDGNTRLATQNLAPGIQVYGEKIISEKGNQSYILAQFDNDGEKIQILNGKYGPYIKKNRKNIPVKNKTEDEIKSLTLDEVQKIINDYIVNGKGSRRAKKVVTAVKKIPIIKKK